MTIANNHLPDLAAIDASDLTPIARRALRRENLQILDWRISHLGGGAGNPVSMGLHRFTGSGQDGDERVVWSVVLKTIQSPANTGWQNMGEGDDPTHWNYWKRELYVYRSNLLTLLPAGMAAARCYDSLEMAGDVAWLWLEDISDDYEGAWPLARYALTARHLGRLNGAFVLGGPLPELPWLSRQRTRQWLAMGPLWQALPWDDPRVRRRYPSSEANAFRRLLFENERFLAKLDLLPKTLCHGDTYPTNFKARRLPGVEEQTVALDWALVGIETIGDDLGQLVYGAHMALPDASLEEVDKTLFASYLAGLHDSGCDLDRQWVRFGYVTAAAMRVGMFQVILLNDELKGSDAADAPAIEHPAGADCFEVAMANEAFELLAAI